MAASIRDALSTLDRHARLFDLDAGGLAGALMGAAVEVMLRDMDAETDPDGAPWPPLSPAYDAWKSAHFGGQPMAVLHGAMKSAEQLRGEARVAAHEAVMTFGTSEEARAEAVYFQEGGGNQPPRPFYGFSAEALARFTAIFQDRLKEI